MQPKTAAVRAALAIAEPDPSTAEQERFLDARNGVKRYLVALAEDVRRHLAVLGLRNATELVGRVDLLEQIAPEAHERAVLVDLSALLADVKPYAAPARRPITCAPSALEEQLLEVVRKQGHLDHTGPICTADRSLGARISGSIAEGSLRVSGPLRLSFYGMAGQGFGFALVDPIELRLRGYANDTVAEVMHGGTVVIVPPANRDSGRSLVGNAAAYGATGGALFVAGRAGQRFGVRNSGAQLVCEGVGKYAFEYMTGGAGAVLGPLGRVIGSGMTGGELFLLDDGQLASRLHADARIAPWDADAEHRARVLIEKHHAATGSAIAAELLADPAAISTRMRRVVSAI
jgi:glutamate synthase domain-containing protein 3